MFIQDSVHSRSRNSRLCPFGIVCIRNEVPFWIVPIQDRVHLGLCLFGMVSIRDGVHSGWCSFGMVFIRDGVRSNRVHSRWCPFRIVYIRDIVHSGNISDTCWHCFIIFVLTTCLVAIMQVSPDRRGIIVSAVRGCDSKDGSSSLLK